MSLWKSEFQAACENGVDSTDSPRNKRIFYESTKRLFLSHCATHFLLFILKPLISSLSTRSNKVGEKINLKGKDRERGGNKVLGQRRETIKKQHWTPNTRETNSQRQTSLTDHSKY